MDGRTVDPEELARPIRERLLEQLRGTGSPPPTIRAIQASRRRSARTYAEHTQGTCAQAGVPFELVEVPPEDVRRAIDAANDDPDVQGIVIYYPVLGGVEDRALQNAVDARKDIEGLSAHWVEALQASRRGGEEPAVVPCTPAGIVHALRALVPAREVRVAAIFNRSPTVGRPLAGLLARAGWRVLSFDVDDVLQYERDDVREVSASRAEALAEADVVITGVPSREFPRVRGAELREGAVVVNFSSYRNVDDDVLERAAAFLPRVGPLSVAMLLSNAFRLRHST